MNSNNENKNMNTSSTIESNSIVFAGPFLGEFGWELSHWTPHVRWLRRQYKGRKFIVASYKGRHPLYYGIADEFWNLPNWFMEKKYGCDCFESLCGEKIYAKLTKHFKDKLYDKYDAANVVWTKTPRGFNKTLRTNNYVIFDKLKASESATKSCNELIKEHGNSKPIVMLFARAMHRKMFLDVKYNQTRHCEDLRNPLPSNNWPRSHWEDLFEMLYKQFQNKVTFVIGGTKSGNCLLNMVDKYPDVIDLTTIDATQSLDVTIAMLNTALCSITSQSGPTHLSIQCGCPSFIYGHEQKRCSTDDNLLGTDVVFLETQLGMYNDSPEVFYKDAAVYIKYLLGQRKEINKIVEINAIDSEKLDSKLRDHEEDIIGECQYFQANSDKMILPTGTDFGGFENLPKLKKLPENSQIKYDIEYNENMLREYSKSAENISKIRWEFISDIEPKRVLDYGSGVGWFRAWRPKNVEVFSFDIGKYSQTGIPEGNFDIICMWDVLEHFKNLDKLYPLLERTKYLALTVPLLPENQDLKIWKHYKPGEHHHHFTKKALDSFMDGYGFKCMKDGHPECPPRQDILSVLYENTEGHSRYKKVKSKIKKIGIVGVFDVAGSTNIPFGKAFANAGYQVDTFNYRTVAREIGWDKTNQEIVKFSAAYDLIIFCKANGVTSEAIRLCGRNAITCWYMMDSIDHIKNDIHYYEMAGAADFSIVTTKAVYDALSNGKIKNPGIYHILQGIDPKEFYPVESEKKYDVVFIGQRTAKRDIALMAIKNAGYSVKAYGQGYNNPVYGRNFNIACSEGRILLAINNSGPDQDSFSDRMFRYMATKGCVLTEYSKGLEIYFMKPKFHWFKTELQMMQEIKRLLDNANLRNITAENGYKTVLANHAWDKVAEQIIKIATGEEKQNER